MPPENIEALEDTDQKESPSTTLEVFAADDRVPSRTQEMIEGNSDTFTKAHSHPNRMAASKACHQTRRQVSHQRLTGICVVKMAEEALQLLSRESVQFVLCTDVVEYEHGEASEHGEGPEDSSKLSMTEILKKQREGEAQVDAAYRYTVRTYYGTLWSERPCMKDKG